MKISEIFYSLQGEGPSIGSPALFIRAANCNLRCKGKWKCDTWDLLGNGKEYTPKKLMEDIINQYVYNGLNSNRIRFVLTGGEPCIPNNAKFFKEFITLLSSHNTIIELETNGTIKDLGLFNAVHQINCSPKLSSSGIDYKDRIKPEVLKEINRRPFSNFKFVIANPNDVTEVNSIVEDLKLDRNKIYLMPAAETKKQLDIILPVVWKACEYYFYKLSTRLHIATFDKKTGI